VYVGLSELFCRLQDADKSARYAARAYDLSRSLQLGDLNSRHHRAALLQMAAALRKKGELGDAHDYCSVKFQLKFHRREKKREKKFTSFRSQIEISTKLYSSLNQNDTNFSTNVNLTILFPQSRDNKNSCFVFSKTLISLKEKFRASRT